MKILKITVRAHRLGACRWASRREEIRLVAVPEGAKTNDLRSAGVELIARSPELVYWASGNQSRMYFPAGKYVQDFSDLASRLVAESPDKYKLA